MRRSRIIATLWFVRIMKRSLLITILLILVAFSPINAQRKTSTPPKKAVVKLSLPTYDWKPFNSNVENLPTKYLGHNAEQLFRIVAPWALEILKGCGKFEKTEECQDRLNQVYDRRIFPTLTARDLLAFSVEVECDYNANTEKVSCPSPFFEYTWSHKLLDSGRYVGQNIFGFKKNVEWKKFQNINIDVNKLKPAFILLKVPPREAELLLPKLRLLLIGDPLQPFAKSKTAYYKPTLDEPTEVTGYNLSFVLNLQQVWLYDVETGKVYQKRNLEPSKE